MRVLTQKDANFRPYYYTFSIKAWGAVKPRAFFTNIHHEDDIILQKNINDPLSTFLRKT